MILDIVRGFGYVMIANTLAWLETRGLTGDMIVAAVAFG